MKAEYESDKEWMSYLHKLLEGQVLNILHSSIILMAVVFLFHGKQLSI